MVSELMRFASFASSASTGAGAVIDLSAATSPPNSETASQARFAMAGPTPSRRRRMRVKAS